MRNDRVELAIRELVEALRAEIQPTPEPTILVGAKTAAALLGISTSSLYALIRSGELPERKVGRRHLIRRPDLEAYAAADGARSGAPNGSGNSPESGSTSGSRRGADAMAD